MESGKDLAARVAKLEGRTLSLQTEVAYWKALHERLHPCPVQPSGLVASATERLEPYPSHQVLVPLQCSDRKTGLPLHAACESDGQTPATPLPLSLRQPTV